MTYHFISIIDAGSQSGFNNVQVRDEAQSVVSKKGLKLNLNSNKP